MKRLPLLLALGLLVALMSLAPAATASAQTPPAAGCMRRYVPNPTTLSSITSAHQGTVSKIADDDFLSLPVGPVIPDSTQDPGGFKQAMQAIYTPGAAQCAEFGLSQGALVSPADSTETAVLVPAPPSPSPLPWCIRRYIPNPPTLDAIPETNTVTTLPTAAFQAMSVGQPVPDFTQAPGDFNTFVQSIYTQNQTRCAQQGLATGNLIGVSGSYEIDVIVPAETSDAVRCLRQATPPSPPAGGAVLAVPLDPNTAEPNVVVLRGSWDAYQWSPAIKAAYQWSPSLCGGAVVSHPTSIAVAAGAALHFQDMSHQLESAWGVVNADGGASPLVLFPGHPEFTPTTAVVWTGLSALVDFAGHTQSCRGCDLAGLVLNELPLEAQCSPGCSPTNLPSASIAYSGSFSGANLSGAQVVLPSSAEIYGNPYLPTWDFSNADLSNVAGLSLANLTGANLTGTNLSGVDLSSADLSSAELTGANLKGANLSGASLTNVNLSRFDLSGTDLSSAALTGANLSGADLTNTDLSNGADLTGADLSGANLSNAALGGTRLISANLSGAQLSGAVLNASTDLTGANLTGADLNNQVLAWENPSTAVIGLNTANFSKANLTEATLAFVDLSGANLTGATLWGAQLPGTNLVQAKLSGARLTYANLGGLLEANLNGANLSGADLSNADLTHSNLNLVEFDGANLTGATLTYAELTYANFYGANLTGATLTHAALTYANFYDANLSGANLGATDLQGTSNLNLANLSKANLSGANLQGMDMSGAHLTGANLQGATLTNTNMAGANLTGADFRGTDLTLTPLASATLSGADLSGANLTAASLTSIQMSGATVSATAFDRADLRGAQVTALQNVAAPSFSDITVGQDDNGNCTSFQNVDLRGSNLSIEPVLPGCQNTPLLPGSTVPLDLISGWLQQELYVNVTNARFAVDATNRSSMASIQLPGVNLSGSVFVGWPVDLSGTNLNGANLANARLPGAVLGGATLQNVSASGASFRGAKLAGIGTGPGASFAGSNTDLTNADFASADVSGASFVAANIGGASFEGALAVAPDFNSVRAANAKFNGAHIHDDSGKAFDNADDLSGADFSGAVLVGDRTLGGGFNLTQTNLNGAKFAFAQCIGCNFTGSNLDNVTFSYAYLMGAVFSNATMLGADMTNAWLYCANPGNGQCTQTQQQPPEWSWPLQLGQGELSGNMPFTTVDFTGVSGQLPKYCPDGTTDWKPDPDQINNTTTPPTVSGVCSGHLQPNTAWTFPVCSAAGSDACPTAASQLFDARNLGGTLLSLVPMTPPVWSTSLGDSSGYAIGLDDHTLRLVGGGMLAGSAGSACQEPTQACGDGGPAGQARLGTPAGLAVGLDGSLYIADSTLHRVRRIDPRGTITTVAGSGQACTQTSPGASDCGNGDAATAAQLMGPYGVWIDPLGLLIVADGPAGLRQVGIDGTLFLLAGTNAYDMRSVVGDTTGSLYAAANNPDYLIQVTSSGTVSVAVGTGSSGYNGNTDPNYGFLLPGNQVQISDPGGLSVDGKGNILFVDTGNNMVRGYVPQSQAMMDPLGGCADANGNPQGGNNGVGQWADQIELSGPLGVTSTAGPLLVVADSGNQRLVQLGPSPLASASSTGPTCETASNSMASLSLNPLAIHTPVASLTPAATHTPVATNTPAATQTPAATHTPVVTNTPAATYTSVASTTPAATHTSVATHTTAATQTPASASTR